MGLDIHHGGTNPLRLRSASWNTLPSPDLFVKQSGTIRKVRVGDRRARETTTVVTDRERVATDATSTGSGSQNRVTTMCS